MKVQSTPGIAEQMMQAAPAGAASPPPETPFQDLLAEAMAKEPAAQKAPQAPSEPKPPKKEQPPAQAAESKPEEAQTPDTAPEAEPDQATMQNVAALLNLPQIVILPDQALPATDPVQTAPTRTAPVTALLTEAAPLPTQSTAQEASQPAEPQPAAPLPQEIRPEQSGAGIESAELIGKGESAPVTSQPAATLALKSDPEAQAKFDAMVEEAAGRLQGKETIPVEPEADEPTAEKTAHEPVRTIPAALRRKSEVSEETLAMAAEPQTAAKELRAQPELRTQAPRQTQEATPARQVEAQVVERLEEGRMEFHMQLNPHDLGRVSVKMVLQDGKLAVQIAAAGEKALEALRKESDGLMASLRTQGVQVETINIVPQAGTASGHMESPFNMAMGSGQGDSSAGQGQGAGKGAPAQGTDAPTDALSQEAQPDRLLDTAV